MLIDWFTVGAQALNFIILVWLMKRFLYKPVLHAIEQREEHIAAKIADADAKDAAAQKSQVGFQHKNQEFDQQRDALLAKAKDEVQVERQRLLDEARQAADALSVKRQNALRNDAQQLHEAISRKAQQEVFAIARKALRDMATTDLEERLAEVFTHRLRDLDGKAKASLGAAFKASSEPVLVRSAFELPAAERATVQHALNESFSADLQLRFETAPDLISGIEVSASGQKLAWTLADYVNSLAEGIDALLKENEKARAQPEAKVEVESQPDAKATPDAKTKSKEKPEPETEFEVDAKAKSAVAARGP